MLKNGHNQNKHVTVIINAKPCAWFMALLTKIMRCILQVRAQEQPGFSIVIVGVQPDSRCLWTCAGNVHSRHVFPMGQQMGESENIKHVLLCIC